MCSAVSPPECHVVAVMHICSAQSSSSLQSLFSNKTDGRRWSNSRPFPHVQPYLTRGTVWEPVQSMILLGNNCNE